MSQLPGFALATETPLMTPNPNFPADAIPATMWSIICSYSQIYERPVAYPSNALLKVHLYVNTDGSFNEININPNGAIPSTAYAPPITTNAPAMEKYTIIEIVGTRGAFLKKEYTKLCHRVIFPAFVPRGDDGKPDAEQARVANVLLFRHFFAAQQYSSLHQAELSLASALGPPPFDGAKACGKCYQFITDLTRFTCCVFCGVHHSVCECKLYCSRCRRRHAPLNDFSSSDSTSDSDSNSNSDDYDCSSCPRPLSLFSERCVRCGAQCKSHIKGICSYCAGWMNRCPTCYSPLVTTTPSTAPTNPMLSTEATSTHFSTPLDLATAERGFRCVIVAISGVIANVVTMLPIENTTTTTVSKPQNITCRIHQTTITAPVSIPRAGSICFVLTARDQYVAHLELVPPSTLDPLCVYPTEKMISEFITKQRTQQQERARQAHTSPHQCAPVLTIDYPSLPQWQPLSEPALKKAIFANFFRHHILFPRQMIEGLINLIQGGHNNIIPSDQTLTTPHVVEIPSPRLEQQYIDEIMTTLYAFDERLRTLAFNCSFSPHATTTTTGTTTTTISNTISDQPLPSDVDLIQKEYSSVLLEYQQYCNETTSTLSAVAMTIPQQPSSSHDDQKVSGKQQLEDSEQHHQQHHQHQQPLLFLTTPTSLQNAALHHHINDEQHRYRTHILQQVVHQQLHRRHLAATSNQVVSQLLVTQSPIQGFTTHTHKHLYGGYHHNAEECATTKPTSTTSSTTITSAVAAPQAFSLLNNLHQTIQRSSLQLNETTVENTDGVQADVKLQRQQQMVQQNKVVVLEAFLNQTMVMLDEVGCFEQKEQPAVASTITTTTPTSSTDVGMSSDAMLEMIALLKQQLETKDKQLEATRQDYKQQLEAKDKQLEAKDKLLVQVLLGKANNINE